MRKVFVALATLLMLAVAAQFFLAAMAAFDTAPKEESFEPHRALGYGILVFALVLTVLAAAARFPGRLIGMAGLLAGLVVLQAVIAGIAGALETSGAGMGGPVVFGLHAINALAIVGVAEEIHRKARELVRSSASAAASVSSARATEPMS